MAQLARLMRSNRVMILSDMVSEGGDETTCVVGVDPQVTVSPDTGADIPDKECGDSPVNLEEITEPVNCL
jgi:hypothetical protein